MLEISPVLELEGGNRTPAPSEQRILNGVTVSLSLDRYKLVPEDYEKTQEDFAREAAGHFYISFGSDEIEEREMAFAGFEVDGAIYTLMDMAAREDSFDTLSQIASELIQASQN